MKKTIYALGFFDGVHIGHAALLRECRTLAAAYKAAAGVATFGAHPDALVLGKAPSLISSPEDRQWLLTNRFGMDTVLTLPFDEHMMHMPWRDFLGMMRQQYGAVGFVCGEDFRFGFRGQGTAPALADYCREAGLPWAVVPEQTLDGQRVSSTRIRQVLEAGDMAGAARLLGHPYVLRGEVLHGRGLGHRLGFPTANLAWKPYLLRPKAGVYVCRATVGESTFPAVTNIGTRPTVQGHEHRAESWLLGFAGDLYGRELVLEFYDFLREERKFESLEALKAQIFADAEKTKAFFETPGEG